MAIYFHSDLHFGVNRYKLPVPVNKKDLADELNILILAGDILDHGYYGLEDLEKWVEPFDKVIMIPGNHEFYEHPTINNDMNMYVKELQGIFSAQPLLQKITFDDMITLEWEDSVIIGCTLWTDLSNEDYFKLMHLRHNMSDFDVIKYKGKKITVDVWQDIHNKHIQYIKHQYETYKDTGKRIIIFTHHAPSYLSVHSRFANSSINGGFITRLEEFILDRPNIHTWIHGHVHAGYDYMIGNTNILCNPYGYNGESYHGCPPFNLLAQVKP